MNREEELVAAGRRHPDAGGVCSLERDIELTLQTRMVRCGNRVLYERRDGPLNWSMFGNTAQALLDERLGVVEHVETLAAGVRLTWLLKNRPPGDGALEIELDSQGLSCAGASAQGIHFADATGTPRVRVGKAFAVDSAGARTELQIAEKEGRLVIRVPQDILVRATYPLAIDPLISPEFGMDQPVRVPARDYHEMPALAWNGTNWLLVWQHGVGLPDSYWQVMAVRVSPDGVPDAAATALSGENFGLNTDPFPAVASDGEGFFVVWEAFDFTNAFDIRGIRLTAAGEVIGQQQVVVGTPGDTSHAGVAGGSDGYLVVWEDRRSDRSIYGTRVSREGVVLDGTGFPISHGPDGPYSLGQYWPTVARGPDGYLAVWTDAHVFEERGDDIFGARIDTNGIVLDPNGIGLCAAIGDQKWANVAANDAGYLVSWDDYRNSTAEAEQTDVYGTLVKPGGEVSDPDGFPIRVAEDYQSLVSIAAGPENFLVVWNDGDSVAPGIYASRVTPDGVILDSDGVLISKDGSGQDVCASGSSFLVVSAKVWDPFTSSILLTRLTDQAEVLDLEPILFTARDNDQSSPALASNGTNWLVVWHDDRNYTNGTWTDIYGVRIGCDGTPLDIAAIPISTGYGFETTLGVASIAGDYLVVWMRDFIGIHGARVRADGVVLDPGGIAMAGTALASDGTNYFAAWSDARSQTNGIYGARINPSGVVLEPNGFLISARSDAVQGGPRLAFNGGHFLVVWEEYQVRYGASNDIYGVRVSPSGAVLDTNKIVISRALNAQMMPAVASNGEDFLVVWDDSRNSPASRGGEIYGARITSEGVVLDSDGFFICTARSYSYPDVAFNGTDYLVVWRDGRIEADAVLQDTRGMWLDRSGAVQLSDMLICADARIPAVAAGPSNTFLVISEATRNGAARVLGNLVSFTHTPFVQSLTVTGGVALLSWHAEAGRTYQVQFRYDLSAPWNDLDPLVIATNTKPWVLDYSASQESQRFYRVVRLP